MPLSRGFTPEVVLKAKRELQLSEYGKLKISEDIQGGPV